MATKEHWKNIAYIASGCLQEGLKPVIVCSAIPGVSNLLEKIIQKILAQADSL